MTAYTFFECPISRAYLIHVWDKINEVLCTAIPFDNIPIFLGDLSSLWQFQVMIGKFADLLIAVPLQIITLIWKDTIKIVFVDGGTCSVTTTEWIELIPILHTWWLKETCYGCHSHPDKMSSFQLPILLSNPHNFLTKYWAALSIMFSLFIFASLSIF